MQAIVAGIKGNPILITKDQGTKEGTLTRDLRGYLGVIWGLFGVFWGFFGGSLGVLWGRIRYLGAI